MDEQIRETRTSFNTSAALNLDAPIFLERDGRQVAVLISIQEYERYQALLEQRQKISALQARRAADRAVFGELVGCALSSGEPIWSPGPEPCWRVPYRLLDGTLLTEVQVNAHTQAVLLTEQEREALLEQVELAVTTGNVSTWSSCGQMAAKHCPTVLTGHSSIDLAKDERVAGMEAL